MATRKSKDQTSFIPPPPIIPEVEHQAVADFARKAYLDYSMYVILDRALPHIADGLKPVQRRIVYAMSELGTVDWGQNFDGTLREPKLLPSRLPHVLLNGASGIAVGMATDIPSHNVREVVSACVELLDNPEATLAQLTRHVKGPDFPTEAEIVTPPAELREMYKTGVGS